MTAAPDLEQHVKNLEARIQVLEDIEEIRAVHATYHDHVDKGWDGKQVDGAGLREVFTPDVSWGASTEAFTDDQVATGETTYSGIDEVVAMLEEATSVFDMANHSFNNEKITVSGDTATGTRTDWVAVTRDGATSMWFLKGSSRYVRTADGWRIQRVDLRYIATLAPPAGQGQGA